MASLIDGYEYDVFISYRQKDNRHDGWVTDFVKNLKDELESTFKEEISVYFDINPTDGLLETYDVDASLKDKLKCLIFIPIISRTYCDPKSFAWEHEFKTFVEIASKDKFGLKVKLANGNVASRVLPIRIHILESDDYKICESVLGTAVRGIEFIYSEPGVNKPLSPNLNSAKYSIQINKVANAIKEIIASLEISSPSDKEVHIDLKPPPVVSSGKRKKIFLSAIITILLLISGIIFIPEFFKKVPEKSIAILPFKNDSPNDSTTYFINGLMEEILIKLQTIKQFSVLNRTSVENYRNSKKTIPEISRQLRVNYIVMGSCQKYGHSLRLSVQLMEGVTGKQIWAEPYERIIDSPDDIFMIQTNIAESIANELKANISTEEKIIIKKPSTSSISAYDFYLRGKEELSKYLETNQSNVLNKAEDFFKKTLKYDSKFAQAYTGLAFVYYYKHYWDSYFSQSFLDSILVLGNSALTYNNQLSEAYCIRGLYYYENGKSELSFDEFSKAIKYNPNDWMTYYFAGNAYQTDDLIKTIDNRQKAASLNRGPLLPTLLRDIGLAYYYAGFPEEGRKYFFEAFNLDNDSLKYFATLYSDSKNYNSYINLLLKAYAQDSNNMNIIRSLGETYNSVGQYKESLEWYKMLFERNKRKGDLGFGSLHRLAYALYKNGFKDEAAYYFDKEVQNTSNLLLVNRSRKNELFQYYDLAAIYAFRGEKGKAYENLRIFNQRKIQPLWMVNHIKTDPLFDSIENEPEFQQIVKEIETKYQAEHERVRKWLAENKMI